MYRLIIMYRQSKRRARRCCRSPARNEASRWASKGAKTNPAADEIAYTLMGIDSPAVEFKCEWRGPQGCGYGNALIKNLDRSIGYAKRPIAKDCRIDLSPPLIPKRMLDEMVLRSAR
jgi:hypothetical protein